MKHIKSGEILAAGLLALVVAPCIGLAGSITNAGYTQVNLVSDGATNATFTDSRLVNPWGIVANEQVVWINDNGTGLTTSYSPSGHPSPFAIQIPGPSGSTNAGTPTGLVFNDTKGFMVTNGSHHCPSTFLMATEDGTIAAWNHSVTGSNAVLVVDNSGSGAVYKSLAIACSSTGGPQLYAANFHAGFVDVFDTNFVQLPSFTDTNLPANFAPFGMRNIRGYLFVTFALQKLPDMHDDQSGPGNGFIDIFSADGVLLRAFAANGALNSPWGMAVAPAKFGQFSHALLVGNFGDGKINAFDLLTGALLGNLTNPDGSDLVIDGLWGLTFESDELSEFDCDFDAQRLYFTAGINGEADGLFGFIRAGTGPKPGHQGDNDDHDNQGGHGKNGDKDNKGDKGNKGNHH